MSTMKFVVAFAAFFAFVGMTSAVSFTIFAGNGQDTTSDYMGGYSRLNPSVLEQSLSFDFSGAEKHVTRSIHLHSETFSLNATRTDNGHTVFVKGNYSMPNFAETYEITYEE
jgi:hypothetical protein